jgi:hypothetical protein
MMLNCAARRTAQRILVARAPTSTDLQSDGENGIACPDAIHSDYCLPSGIKPALL